MNKQVPCAEWEEQLAASIPEDLSVAQRAALDAHMQTCSGCAWTYADYNFLTARVRALPGPVVQPLLRFSALIGEKEERAEGHDFHSSTLVQQVRPKVRRSGFLQRVNMIAAILIVGVIIGSSLLLFASRHAATESTRPPVSKPAGARSSCTFAVRNAPDLAYVCAHYLYQDVNLTKSIGSYKLTIEQVYVDTNQMVMSYTIRGSGNQNYGIDSLDATTTTRQGFALQFVRSGVGGGGYGWYDAQRKASILVQSSYFTFTSNPINIRTIQLHVQVNDVDVVKEYIRKVNDVVYVHTDRPPFQIPLHGPVNFDFSAPFYPARIADVHQTITMGKASVTLERVLVTPSMAHLFIRVHNVNVGNLIDECLPFSLSVGGKNNFINGVNEIDYEAGIITSFQPIYRYPLLNEHGEWTFSVREPQRNGSVWVFHFVVP